MIRHGELGTTPEDIRKALRHAIRNGEIRFDGYRKGRIYGRLDCPAGRRMKWANRVFFRSEEEAIDHGYRPCARCLPEQYREWRRVNEGGDPLAPPTGMHCRQEEWGQTIG